MTRRRAQAGSKPSVRRGTRLNLISRWLADRFDRVGLHALDDRHLEIRLKLPIAYYLDLTAFSTYLPIHSSIEKLQENYQGQPLTAEGLWTYDPQWTKPDYHRNQYPGIISNGAYHLERWDFKQALRLDPSNATARRNLAILAEDTRSVR